MNKPLPRRLRYLLVFATASFGAYMIDAYVVNITGFLIGALVTGIYALLEDE